MLDIARDILSNRKVEVKSGNFETEKYWIDKTLDVHPDSNAEDNHKTRNWETDKYSIWHHTFF